MIGSNLRLWCMVPVTIKLFGMVLVRKDGVVTPIVPIW